MTRVGKEEEGEYEYISNYHGAENGKGEAHIEPAVLYQPLNGEEAGMGGEAATLGSAVPLCKAGAEGPCARPARGGEGTCKSCRRRHHGGGNGGGGIIEKCAHGAAKGAVTGAAGGAAAGAVGGEGAGAGPGAVAGAVGGAVAGCLSEVIP